MGVKLPGRPGDLEGSRARNPLPRPAGAQEPSPARTPPAQALARGHLRIFAPGAASRSPIVDGAGSAFVDALTQAQQAPTEGLGQPRECTVQELRVCHRRSRSPAYSLSFQREADRSRVRGRRLRVTNARGASTRGQLAPQRPWASEFETYPSRSKPRVVLRDTLSLGATETVASVRIA
jgi:hypothetical protein